MDVKLKNENTEVCVMQLQIIASKTEKVVQKKIYWIRP